MISINEALRKVLESQSVLDDETIILDNALGYYLAEDIYSTIAVPPFDRSIMDGFALVGEFDSYQLIGEIKTGDPESKWPVKAGEALRIFTGAHVPDDVTAVAQQEIVTVDNGSISLEEDVSKGKNIQRKGEEISVGDLVLKKGTTINPAAIGLLSGLGVQTIKVVRKPKITLLITGNELAKPTEKLASGKIYESNSHTLKAALRAMGLHTSVEYVKDDYQITEDRIRTAIPNNDLVIVTGGISVGDYDFVGKALNEIGVDQVFYKVNQKPGKPLYYGVSGKTKVFALPGNPAAALTCFYMYVATAIKAMMGDKHPSLIERTAKLKQSYSKKGNRAVLLKAHIDNGEVKIHIRQSSAMLSSFVEANCLLFLPKNEMEYKAGEKIKVYMLS